ncbi:MAG: mechanosensitive ion channel family protein [Cyanobacteria bacterium P01_H01_bin.21]
MASRFSARWRDSFLSKRFLLISLLTCVLVITFATPTSAQIPSLELSSDSTLRPPEVNRYGSLEVTWVTSPLSGKKLFQIAAPTVFDRSDLSQMQMAVEVRAKNIENLIWVEIKKYRKQELARLFNPKANLTPPPSARVITSTLRSLPVIQLMAGNSRPLTLATVTPSDVDFYSQTPEQVAEQWRSTLQAEATSIQALLSPLSLRQRIQETVGIVLGLIVLTAVVFFIRWQLYKKQRALKDKLTAEAAEAVSEKPDLEKTQTALSEIEIAQSKPKQFEPEQLERDKTTINQVDEKDTDEHLQPTFISEQADLFVKQRLRKVRWLDIYKSIRWILLWMLILSWYVSIYLITTRLPSLMRWSEKVLTQPLRLIFIWFLVSLAIRISSFLIQRSLRSWNKISYLSVDDTQRRVVRSHTISTALQDLTAFILFSLGILLTLVEFGLSPTSIFAGSAIIGFAVSFGTQSLVKDLVNGCVILLEDQFAVGDIIAVNGESGVVERLDLRLTQLRNLDGELISIPNSTITMVKNKSNSWARVNLGVNVAYDTDLDDAIAVIKAVSTQMSQDAEWQSLILEPPEVLGVDSFNDSSITIRLLMRTAPAQQWLVARELRRRLKQALDQADISIPLPQRSIWLRDTRKALSSTNTAIENQDAVNQ